MSSHGRLEKSLPRAIQEVHVPTKGANFFSVRPPYDIAKTGDDSYRISIAVAGFAQDDLDITFQSNLLTVTGKKQEGSADGYLHRGIAGRSFEHRFELADHVRVNGADLSNGLLSIELVREIPEALKPRKISIQGMTTLTAAAPAQIEAQKAA
jgi:molecular chaperone IbpA